MICCATSSTGVSDFDHTIAITVLTLPCRTPRTVFGLLPCDWRQYTQNNSIEFFQILND